jgi:hypothetical protein
MSRFGLAQKIYPPMQGALVLERKGELSLRAIELPERSLHRGGQAAARRLRDLLPLERSRIIPKSRNVIPRRSMHLASVALHHPLVTAFEGQRRTPLEGRAGKGSRK